MELDFREALIAWLVGLTAVSLLVAVACDGGLLRASLQVAETAAIWLLELALFFLLL